MKKPIVVQLVAPFWQVLDQNSCVPELFRTYGKALSHAQKVAHDKGVTVEVDTGIDRFVVGPGDRLISKTDRSALSSLPPKSRSPKSE